MLESPGYHGPATKAASTKPRSVLGLAAILGWPYPYSLDDEVMSAYAFKKVVLVLVVLNLIAFPIMPRLRTVAWLLHESTNCSIGSMRLRSGS